MVVMRMADENRIGLDDPIWNYAGRSAARTLVEIRIEKKDLTAID